MYVSIAEEEGDEPIEIPTESDNTLLLSSVTAQFPNATGLKYRNVDTMAFRGLRLADGKFFPPDNGWENLIFLLVAPKDFTASDNKRKGDESMENPTAKTKRIERKCSDLIVLGLPWAATEDDLKTYFEEFGELLMAQVKRDGKSGQSKGYGFIRFGDIEAQDKVLSKRHKVGDRLCDVRIPNSKAQDGRQSYGMCAPMGQQYMHGSRPGPGGDMGYNYGYGGYEGSQNGGYGGTYGHWGSGANRDREQHNRKVFVGRCTEDMTADDLRSHFSKYGDILDVFIPKPFRAFAFVTFKDPDTASQLWGEDHIINGVSVHVSVAVPREPNRNRLVDQSSQQNSGGGSWGGAYGPGAKANQPPAMGAAGNWGTNGAGNGSLSGNNPLGMAGLNIGGFQVNPHALLAAALQQNAMNILGQAMNQQPGAPQGPPGGQTGPLPQQRPGDMQMYQGYGSPSMGTHHQAQQPMIDNDPSRQQAQGGEYKPGWSGAGDASASGPTVSGAGTAGWSGSKQSSWN